MHAHRLFAVLALGLVTLAVSQCGSVAPADTSPSPTPRGASPPAPAPSPTPAPAPGPAPGAAGSSLSVSPATIQGQAQPQATVTLAAAAPDGGALVVLRSDNPTVAKVPAAVTVSPGSRNATFLVETSTVVVPTNVTITASYGGTSMTATLTVKPPALVASFAVRSRTRGLGACGVDSSTLDLDCVFDASASQGFIGTYLWTHTMGPTTQRQTAAAPNAVVSPQGASCALYQQGTGGDDSNGDRYLRMEVTLQVRDGAGVVSDVVRQPVRVYPNRQCG
ncbi:MAG TPA: hypothetical protein VKC35_13555, partial [Vicinamibacterales bacterium]|nr:hypothetical protein [Vicinamibacterales bacterium]